MLVGGKSGSFVALPALSCLVLSAFSRFVPFLVRAVRAAGRRVFSWGIIR